MLFLRYTWGLLIARKDKESGRENESEGGGGGERDNGIY